MAPAEPEATIGVSVAYSPGTGQVDEVMLALPQRATVIEALRASGLLERHPQIDLSRQRVGVWGKLQALDAPLRDRDRVEVYRALQVDPMEARRQRQRKQRQRAG
jgi:putative ubiquitin-RnfH superfamily antitoxin RatB of RatAB toxin-antitoxin module